MPSVNDERGNKPIRVAKLIAQQRISMGFQKTVSLKKIKRKKINPPTPVPHYRKEVSHNIKF